MRTVLEQMQDAIGRWVPAGSPMLLMVSGGSDSASLAYLAAELRDAGMLACPLAMLHVNHHLRGAESDADAAFVTQLASLLGVRLFMHDADVAAMASEKKENVEALARRVRYLAAADALQEMFESSARLRGASGGGARVLTCRTASQQALDSPRRLRNMFGGGEGALAERDIVSRETPESAVNLHGASVVDGKVRANETAASPIALPADGFAITAHTADDRAETFFMRSIVGTGPGGFRAMRYAGEVTEGGRTVNVLHPLLDCSREQLRTYLVQREDLGKPVLRDAAGHLWREDSTNADADYLRAYVRKTMVPAAKEKNPRFLETLTRSMNLMGDEDDMLEAMADDLLERFACRLDVDASPVAGASLLLAPELGKQPLPLQRRALFKALGIMLEDGERIETQSIDAVLAAWNNGLPVGGYVANIQGNLAVSANKRGVRIEPMAAFRARRKKI